MQLSAEVMSLCEVNTRLHIQHKSAGPIRRHRHIVQIERDIFCLDQSQKKGKTEARYADSAAPGLVLGAYMGNPINIQEDPVLSQIIPSPPLKSLQSSEFACSPTDTPRSPICRKIFGVKSPPAPEQTYADRTGLRTDPPRTCLARCHR